MVSLEERIFITMLMAEFNDISVVKKKFLEKYGKDSPADNVLHLIFDTFKSTGSINNLFEYGSPSALVKEEIIEDSCTSIGDSNKKGFSVITPTFAQFSNGESFLEVDMKVQDIEYKIPSVENYIKEEEEEMEEEVEDEGEEERNEGEVERGVGDEERRRGDKEGGEYEEKCDMLCNLCLISYSDIVDYFVHMLTHSTKGPYSCFKCSFELQSKRKMKRHLISHRPKNTCPVCGVRISKKSEFHVHLSKHSKELPYDCPRCGFRSALSIDTKQHIIEANHKEWILYNCSYCDQDFPLCTDYQSHMESHDIITCSVCSFTTFYPEKISTHLKRHTEKNYTKSKDPLAKIIKCSDCSYTCDRNVRLRQHRQVHMKKKNLKCAKCDYTCGQRSYLRKHQRVHTQERKFACTFCSYRANSSGTLTTHIRTHTGERPYTCTVCSFASKTCSALNRHIKVIHCNEKKPREKKELCNICGKNFFTKYDLKVHVRGHTGERPYACAFCSFSTTSSSACLRHTKRKHGNDMETLNSSLLVQTMVSDHDVDVAVERDLKDNS